MYLTAEISDLIEKGALFVINDSAGKDSQAMKVELIRLIPKRQLVIVHANLPEVDWDGNMDHIRKYSQEVPVFEVVAGKTFFQMVDHRKKFPSPRQRQCTSDLKRAPIQKFINNYAKQQGFQYVVNCMGIRAEESSARKKKIPFKFTPNNSAKHRQQYQWFPIFYDTLEDVKKTVSDAGQMLHWAYLAGMTRLSCCFCIMATQSDLKTAARLKPVLAKRYMDYEDKLNFTLSMSRVTLREIIYSGRDVKCGGEMVCG